MSELGKGRECVRTHTQKNTVKMVLVSNIHILYTREKMNNKHEEKHLPDI